MCIITFGIQHTGPTMYGQIISFYYWFLTLYRASIYGWKHFYFMFVLMKYYSYLGMYADVDSGWWSNSFCGFKGFLFYRLVKLIFASMNSKCAGDILFFLSLYFHIVDPLPHKYMQNYSKTTMLCFFRLDCIVQSLYCWRFFPSRFGNWCKC